MLHVSSATAGIGAFATSFNCEESRHRIGKNSMAQNYVAGRVAGKRDLLRWLTWSLSKHIQSRTF